MIIHYVDQFSRKSETFIYNLIIKLSSSYEQLVMTERLLLERERPFNHVLVMNGGIGYLSRVGRRLFDRYALASKHKIKAYVLENPGSTLIVHFLNNGIGAFKIFGCCDQKIIIMCYGSDVNRINTKNKFIISIIKSINKNNNVKFIAVSNFIKEKLIKLGVHESKISIYYPSFNILTKNIKESNGIKKIISVGRLSEEKGFEYLVSAFSFISKKYPEIELEIFGEGPLLEGLKDHARKNNANISFRGYKPHQEILASLDDADLYVQPSVKLKNGTEEGIATAVLEAISFGLPCIVTDIGGMKEVVIDEVSGYVVAERSESELRGAILKYINNPQLLGIHSENAALAAKTMDKQSEAIFDLVRF